MTNKDFIEACVCEDCENKGEGCPYEQILECGMDQLNLPTSSRWYMEATVINHILVFEQ